MTYRNQDSIEMFDRMTAMGHYYASARPVQVDPAVIISDVCSKLPISRDDVILDLGCGTGVVTIPLSKLCKFIHAVDAGQKVIEQARLKCREEKITNVTHYVGGALSLPFENNFFDHVLMYAVIHYLENEDQVKQCVSELVRVCKPGGRILIAEIPDRRAREEFDRKEKTPEEKQILERFNASRGEYDRLFKEHVPHLHAPNSLVLDCERIVAEAARLGCEGSVMRQDIRQPLSLTRRDVLLIKGNK